MDALGFTRTVSTPAPETPEGWRRDLVSAAERIERDGFWQLCVPSESLNPVCVILALPAEWEDAGDRLAAFLGLSHRRMLPRWNDAPGRTAAEVCAALRACARS